ncbi:glycosyltransferase family 4 protein [Flavobacterium sp. MFBS3-15]|uniref:glycosyltransferase family 4 protein n=1 Tax=Flavobacterium sp. MFBS3-15 TaxID=2989816 RepID=UPI0022361A51|nr:glycosyltransferase family 4 protein [Flavobacterium sp. MFBS3-15]MCW4469578.1 glycosyltransferase family 4 protein [Flavobacterium sp. MFBS3-15]
MNSGKQIVFVNQSSGYLMIDIIESFEGTFDERILMAGYINPRNKSLDESIKVVKLCEYNRSSSIKRIFTWGWAFLKALFLILIKYRKAHLFLVSNPPFATLIPLFCRNTFDILIFDIYPDALVEFNYFKKDSLITKKWEKWNRKVFARAKNVFTLTDGMKERLMKYVSGEQISVIPVWTDNDFLKPVNKNENVFLKKHKLTGKFVVMYSGNMGKTHPVGIMVDLAERMKDNESVYFMLIGGGDQYKDLEAKIISSNLSNISILPWQPTEQLPNTLPAASLSLVTLGNEASDISIPSKTFNLMSVGVPVICVAQHDSALSALVAKESIGKAFGLSDHDAIVEFILEAQSNPAMYEEMVQKVLLASQNYTPLNAKKFNTFRNETV